jgi:1,2-dihydroxy-3-keto-5-methylthiopentene dioxygenase
MTRLRIFAESDPTHPQLETQNPTAIIQALATIGVKFERWHASVELAAGAQPEDVIAAYRDDIDRLMQAGGYQSVDVVSLHAEHPNRTELRQKFLNEHTHAEDEIRFFVAGSGLFTIHADEKVFEVECVKNDLINLPAGTRHWFDMGAAPFFIAIRIFTNPSGCEFYRLGYC